MREFGLGETPIIMAGGVWWLEEWEDWIDNPGARPDRLPVRHAPAADQGKPDQRMPGSSAADAEGGRRLPQPLQPHRLLFQRGRTTTSCRNCAAAASARSPTPPSRWASMSPNTASARASAIVYLTPRIWSARVRLGRRGLHRGAAHAGHDADLRHPGKAAKSWPTRSACMGCLSPAASPTGRSTSRISPTARRPTRAASASRRRCRTSRTPATTRELENNLMFSGHNAFRFAKDPFYSNGFIPTV
jgi:nitronate monooxygenase